MRKNKKTIFILISSLILLGIFVVFITQKVYYAPNDEIVISKDFENKIINDDVLITKTSIKSIQTFNSHLTIPSLLINAKIQDVGITSKGNISTPNNFFDVGLYKYGPLPGGKGIALIDGHVNNGFGLNAVFGNLKNIKIGDDVYVEIEKDVKIHFIVTAVDVYNYNAPTKNIFETTDDKSYLKLITCSGTWMPSLHTHDKRFVVTAIKSNL